MQINEDSFKKVFILLEKVSSMREYIELNAFIKVLGLASTGGQAKLLIRSGVVSVNSEIETRNKKKLRCTDIVEVDGKTYIVTEKYFQH